MEGETPVVNKSRENIAWHPRFRVKVSPHNFKNLMNIREILT
jgi:hypothetical protein